MKRANWLMLVLALLLSLAALTAFATACGDDDDDDDDTSADDDDDDTDDDDDDDDPFADAQVHACGHFEETPIEVSAGDEPAAAVDVNTPHTAYDVTLTTYEDAMGGYLSYTVAEDGSTIDAVLNVDTDIKFWTEDLTEIPATTTADESDCETIHKLAKFELDAGNYYITLGPTDEDSLLMFLLVNGGHDEDDDHEMDDDMEM
ncbi:MAG: hypothetical protein H6685_02810 [Deltaproteobacteria bacterium]|nr:hypothetical protein [Deltaproteobacteria bacterium]